MFSLPAQRAASRRSAAISIGAVAVGLLGTSLYGTGARAAPAEDGVKVFGLVDLSIASESTPEPLKREIERLARRRGLTKLSDPGMQRALDGPQATAPVIAHMVADAHAKQDDGDCAAAVALARHTETAALEELAVDDEREPLKAIYALLVTCEHELGHADLARAAGVRLRTLVSLPPSDLSRALWETYAAGSPVDAGASSATPAAATAAASAPAATPPAGPAVELIVDSDPPNARVAINFHVDGVTPRTLKLPPGVVTLELEKAGYKKAFRTVTLAREHGPTRVVFHLADRREDRAAQVESAVVKLRGSDPTTHPTTLARLAELARVDVLVAIAVSGGTVKLWWFDSDRGDLTDDPIESPFDASSGKLTGKLLRSSGKDSPRPGAARAGESAPPP